MTVSSQTNKIIYIGNGVAKEFAIPFSFLEKEHLKVRQKKNDIQTELTDWTVKNGNLVFAIAPASGAEIAIVREVPLTQETDYRDNEILHAETLERNFDKLTMQVQQLAEKQDRAVTVDIFDDTQAAELIPSIRKAVSDCQTAVETTTANITAAAEQVQTATAQATAAATSATNAATSETNTAAMLGTKANVDANNFSEAGKKAVVSWCIPDYSAGIEIAITTTERTYTCPENGLIVFDCGGQNSNCAYLKINDVLVLNGSSTNQQWTYGESGQFLVSQGDVCQFKSGVTYTNYGTQKFTFFPAKGV